MIRVMIADDTLIAREGWKKILETVDDIQVIGEATVADEVFQKVMELQPNVLLLDLRWFNNENAGASAIARIKQQSPGAKIIAVTAYSHLVDGARRVGVDTVLPKGFSKEELVSVIRAVNRDETAEIPYEKSVFNTAAAYIQQLDSISTGTEDARKFEDLIEQILPFVLEPHLSDLRAQSRAAEGTQIRDFTMFNRCENAFWRIVAQKHGAVQIIFEAKNVEALTNGHIIQLADYLKEPLGHFGIIVTRAKAAEARMSKVKETFKAHGKMVLILSDQDIRAMLEARANAREPADIIMQRYLEITDQI